MEADAIWQKVLPRLRDHLGRTGWKTLQLISDRTDSKSDTVGGWLTNARPPVGVRLIVLWHLLELLGEPSPELRQLPEFNRYLGELLALGVIDVKGVGLICNVRNEQTCVHILRGQPPMHPQYDLRQLKAQYGDFRQRALSALPKQSTKAPTTSPRTPKETHEAPHLPMASGNDELTLSMLIGAARPLAHHMVSDAVNEASRARFRELVGQQAFFEFLNDITALQSRRARDSRR